MFEHDYIEFFEIEDSRPTWFDRWIWPALGFVLVVSASVVSGFVEAYCAMRDGLACLREDVKHAWRSRK